MWKLSVVRHYTLNIDGNEFDNTDEVHFESSDISDLADIVDTFREYGVGEFTYTIVLKGEK